MNFEIKTSSYFDSEIKRLSKRHRSFIEDLKAFLSSLKENPFQGVELTPGVRKVRLAIRSKGKGKSGGVRIITFTTIVSNDESTIYLLLIYDKSDSTNVNVEALKSIIKELDL